MSHTEIGDPQLGGCWPCCKVGGIIHCAVCGQCRRDVSCHVLGVHVCLHVDARLLPGGAAPHCAVPPAQRRQSKPQAFQAAAAPHRRAALFYLCTFLRLNCCTLPVGNPPLMHVFASHWVAIGQRVELQLASVLKPPLGCCLPQGRMIDHLRNTQSVGLEDLAVLILDEADRLLEMGFAEEVR